MVPIRTANALQQEGRTQHHCVATYGNSVAAGRAYVYRVLSPERATVALVKSPAGTWEMAEIRLTGNDAVSEKTRRKVLEWMSAATVGAV